MINTTSVSTLNPILVMADGNTSNSSIFVASKQYLLECEQEIINNTWNAVLKHCHQCLSEFPISHRIENKNSSAYTNFRRFASGMLSNNHNYDSVINLLNIGSEMAEFTETFFHSIDKKGVHLPKPVPSKEEVLFIYSFCVGFYNMMVSNINE